MKILWVKAGGLVPPDTGGKIRSYNILRHLAKYHAITFFSFHAYRDDAVHAQLSQIFDRVIRIPLNLPSPKSIWELLRYVLYLSSTEPYNLKKYCRPVARKGLLALLQKEKYDVIVCDFLVAAGVIPWDWPGPKVLFTHNVESLIWRRHYEVSRNILWRALSWLEWKKMEASERKYLQKADQVIAVSENDRKVFARILDPRKLTVITTGVDTEFFQPGEEQEIPNSLVFTGSMDWLPNEDAIFYFAEEILPLVRRQVPDVTLCVVGRKPSRRLENLAARLPNIQLTGWVEDVRPYVAKRAVYIVPLRIGGGTRLKIFEAMSMAKAVISTSIGAEGLPVKSGEHLLIADDPSGFAASILRLLSDASLRVKLGQTARRLVEENHEWAMVSKDFSEILQNLVRQAPKDSPDLSDRHEYPVKNDDRN
jgi:sugar transferase (PEP-CTERM/EpsH1 system associated)